MLLLVLVHFIHMFMISLLVHFELRRSRKWVIGTFLPIYVFGFLISIIVFFEARWDIDGNSSCLASCHVDDQLFILMTMHVCLLELKLTLVFPGCTETHSCRTRTWKGTGGDPRVQKTSRDCWTGKRSSTKGVGQHKETNRRIKT